MCVWLFWLFLGLFSSCWVTLSSFNMRIFALSYCISFWVLIVISWRPVPFIWKWKGVGSEEEGRWEVAGRNEKKEKCDQYVLWDRKLFLNNNNSNRRKEKEWLLSTVGHPSISNHIQQMCNTLLNILRLNSKVSDILNISKSDWIQAN